MQRDEVARVVGVLVAAFPAVSVNEKTVQIYTRLLADLPYEETLLGVKRVLASARFFPSIAEIREAVADVQHGTVRSGEDAWLDVASEVRRVGYCGKPRFADPIVAELVTRWGWRRMCCDGEETADRARFCRAYDAIAKGRRLDAVSGVDASRRLVGAAKGIPELVAGIGNGGVR